MRMDDNGEEEGNRKRVGLFWGGRDDTVRVEFRFE